MMFTIAFAVHEEWPHPLVGWATAACFFTLGGMTIYNYLFGSHKGHPVYMRMLLVYLALAALFLIRSYGLFIGPRYWATGATAVFVLWLVVRPYQSTIKREKTLGIKHDYFRES